MEINGSNAYRLDSPTYPTPALFNKFRSIILSDSYSDLLVPESLILKKKEKEKQAIAKEEADDSGETGFKEEASDVGDLISEEDLKKAIISDQVHSEENKEEAIVKLSQDQDKSLNDEEFKKYRMRMLSYIMRSFGHSMEYFYEYIGFFEHINYQISLSSDEGKNSLEKKEWREFVASCVEAYRLLADEKGYDKSLYMDPKTYRLDSRQWSWTRKYRSKWFPPSNALRLLFAVRIPNVFKDIAVMAGDRNAQRLYTHVKTFACWVPFLGWLYYLPRIGVNFVISIRNTLRAKAFSRERGFKSKLSAFFRILFQNSAERMFEYFNDLMWAVIGTITCFVPAAAALTPLLYLYDIGVESARACFKIKTWAKHLHYAHADADNKNLSSFDPRAEKKFGHWNVDWDGVGSGVVNLDEKPSELTASDAESYKNKDFLAKLYMAIHKECHSHEATLIAWTNHVCFVKSRLSSEDNALRLEIQSCIAYYEKHQKRLRRFVNKPDAKSKILLSTIEHPEYNPYAVSTSRKYLVFQQTQRRLRSARKESVKNITFASILAAGMLLAYSASGNHFFGTSLVMPYIPALATIGVAIVMITAAIQFFMPKKSKSGDLEEKGTIKYGSFSWLGPLRCKTRREKEREREEREKVKEVSESMLLFGDIKLSPLKSC